MCVCVYVCSEANKSREVWRALYKLGVEDHVKSQCTDRQSTQANYGVFCDICKRSFRREGDKKRHKYTAERKKTIAEQVGATQCLYAVGGFGAKVVCSA